MSLRLRLTLLCVGLVGLVLTMFAISTFFFARERIYASFDDSLKTEADVVKSLLPADLGPELPQGTRSELEVQAAGGALFQVRGADGSILFSSFRGSPSLLPRKDLESESYFDGDVAGQDLRLLYVPLPRHPGAYIEVAKPTQATDQALTLIGGTLAGGALLALLLTVVPAYLIAGRALRPIREVSGLARRIEQTSDFTQRLRREHTAKEIGELITTFNDLISRIEHTLKSHNEFLAESSHELRRPLTNLRTNLDILRDPRLPEADRDACIERMSREALAMSALVGDLLLLTRDKSQAFDRSEVNLSEVCAEEAARATFAYPGTPLASDIEPGVIVMGDAGRLGQMLRNLLENAASYGPPGAAVEVSLSLEDGQASLRVRDHGYGIPEDEQARVFERFHRGEKARLVRREGVGLGLAIVKYVVEGHDGTVSVASPHGGGTLFTIVMPASGSREPVLPHVLAVS